MRLGHRRAQDMFLEIGTRHGFDVRRSFAVAFPGDGVWVLPRAHGQFAGLPVVALEVVVSETPKTVLGSIATLERIGPSLGVLLIHEVEIGRRLVAGGATRDEVEAYMGRTAARVDAHLASARHRIERWSFAKLAYLHSQLAA